MKNEKVQGIALPAILLQILLLPVFVWLVWGLDIWMAVSLSYPAYIFIGLISCGLLLIPYASVRRNAVMVVPAIWLVFLVALPLVTNSALKPLIRGVGNLEQSMDRDAVFQTLVDRYASTQYPSPVIFGEERFGESSNLNITRLCIKPRGRDGGFSAESLLVFLEDGRFSHASFMPD